MIFSHIKYKIVMGYSKITTAGRAFLVDYAKKQSPNSLLTGNNGEFIYSIDVPVNKQWKSNAKKFNSNVLIEGNVELINELIKYYEHYCELMDLDANFMMAQTYVESNFKVWTYAPKVLNSTASGMIQFLMSTIYHVIIKNNDIPDGYEIARFTQDEIDRITNGISDVTLGSDDQPIPLSVIKNNVKYFKPAENTNAMRIRLILHQNLIDNLDIMVKAHCSFMRNNLNIADNYIASALFGYNRGPSYIKPSFKETLNTYLKSNDLYGSGYKEGSHYVAKIFKLVSNKFGYNENRKLDLSKKYNAFND